MAILAKRMGVAPPGWEAAAGKFADPTPRSVADIDSPESLAKVRQWKKAQKAAHKDKQDRPLQALTRAGRRGSQCGARPRVHGRSADRRGSRNV